ncbi:unnamed protein product [Ixodes pacificus]
MSGKFVSCHLCLALCRDSTPAAICVSCPSHVQPELQQWLYCQLNQLAAATKLSVWLVRPKCSSSSSAPRFPVCAHLMPVYIFLVFGFIDNFSFCVTKHPLEKREPPPPRCACRAFSNLSSLL